jgi:hypothetical protein
MKKLVLTAMILVLVPFSAYSLEAVSDAGLGDITAQDGVNIQFDDVKIYQSSGSTAWQDGDSTILLMQSGGTFTLIDEQADDDIVTTIQAYDSSYVDAAISQLQIDVSTTNDITGVVIGLPVLKQVATAKTTAIYLQSDDTYDGTGKLCSASVTPATYTDAAHTTAYTGVAAQKLGTLIQDGSATYVLGGTITITADSI